MRCLATVVLLAWASTALAGPPLWRVDSQAGSLYILGSIHLLKPADYPLPEEVSTAYAAAADLVMELDMDDIDLGYVTDRMLALGMSGDDPDARTVLGPDEWARATARAAQSGVDLEPLGGAEPWLVGLMVYNLALARAGYDPELGVDQSLARRAIADGKPIAGLETVGEQLALFDGLPAEVQRQMLEQTLTELEDIKGEAETLVAAWRSGDLASLRTLFAEEFSEYPELQSRLVEARNRAWLPVLEARLEEPGVSLVVVGALHTVGPAGLPALLEGLGYEVRRCVGAPAPRGGSAQLP